MRELPITRAEFEITHICDKMCDNCSHRIKTSNFTSISFKDMIKVLKCFKKPKQIKSILVIGGEPLCHPHLQGTLELIRNSFLHIPRNRRVVSTNGKQLDRIQKEVFDLWTWKISEYPGWNDEIVKKYEGKKNIRISHWGYGWWPLVDPNLSLQVAKQVEKRCFHQIRIVGTKLYRCCLAEGVERTYKTGKVHVEMSPNWLNDWRKIPVWKACQHCFKANHILGKWTKPMNKIVRHN